MEPHGLDRRRRLGAVALGLALALATPATVAAAGERPADRAEIRPRPSAARPAEADAGTLLVRFRPGTDRQAADDEARRHGARVKGEVNGTGVSLVSTEGRPADEVRRDLESSSLVEAVEPNFRRQAATVPNDPLYSEQASYLQSVGLPQAWERVTGADDLTLAVLDSGVDLAHPDLAGRLVPPSDRWDFVNNDAVPADDHPQSHGTMVAGVAAAGTNNGRGVAGAAWRGSLMPVKVLNSAGEALDSDIAAGITWAVNHGADVINLSLGGPGESDTLQRAVDYALARNVVVVAAAGNASTSEPHYPAAARGVVAVGATDSAGRLAYFSNYGSWIDLTAPGDNVTSTVRGGYDRGAGTSFSAPLVSGVALLLRAADPTAGQATIVDRLRRSATDLGSGGFDTTYGFGLLDAAAALGLASASGPGGVTAGGSGYWMLGAEGRVYDFGAAPYLGEPVIALGTAGGAVDIEPAPAGGGYWIVDRTGAVFAYGSALYLGGVTTGRLRPGESVTSLSATPEGRGYWIFTTSGRVFPFGDAAFLGDMGAIALNGPVLDSIPSPSGRGYYMVASDGGIFAFGDARYAGSMGNKRLNAPVQSLVPDSDGSGYWLVASDGGIFAFDAPFRGSMGGKPLNAPVTGMVPFGNGYLMVATDGGVFNFSDQPFSGSLGSSPPAVPIVAVAALPG